MKNTLLIACLFALSSSLKAQDSQEESHGFKMDHVFVGASLGLGFGSGVFNVGGNPEVGYSITNWLDAGISGNINYTSIKPQYNNNYRQRSTIYGGGAFLRMYPVRGLFLQVLPEYNWIKSNVRDMQSGTDFKLKDQAPSLLLGVGYGSHVVGQTGFFTSISFDVGNNSNSPYINYYLDNYGNVTRNRVPVIRTGFNVYLGRRQR